MLAAAAALLLCCVAGCSTNGTWVSAKQPAVQETVACDPYFGFHPTCWHPWPFCDAQPATIESPPPVQPPPAVEQPPVPPQPPTLQQSPMPWQPPVGAPDNGKPVDRPAESLPAPGAEPPRPAAPGSPGPQADDATPTFPNAGLSETQFKSTYFERESYDGEGWPVDVLIAAHEDGMIQRR